MDMLLNEVEFRRLGFEAWKESAQSTQRVINLIEAEVLFPPRSATFAFLGRAFHLGRHGVICWTATEKLEAEDSISLDWASRSLVPGCTHNHDNISPLARRVRPYLHIYCMSISLTAACAISRTFRTAVLALMAEYDRRTWVNSTTIVVELAPENK